MNHDEFAIINLTKLRRVCSVNYREVLIELALHKGKRGCKEKQKHTKRLFHYAIFYSNINCEVGAGYLLEWPLSLAEFLKDFLQISGMVTALM